MKIRKELADRAVKQLLAHSAFSGAKEETLRYILASEKVLLREAAKGQQIYPCHGAKKCICLVLTGSCHLLKGGRIAATVADGFVFGAEELYSAQESSVALTAAQNCKAVIIKKAAVDWLLQDDFSAAKSYLEFLSGELVAAAGKKGTPTACSAEKELARYLLGRPENSKGELALPPDLLKIAKQLNLNKDMLFKALETLNSSGAIQFNGKAVCIADKEKLKKHLTDNTD